MDRRSVLFADGLPYKFDAFALTGHTPPKTKPLPYFGTLEPIPVTTESDEPRWDALPLGRDVVAFPTKGVAMIEQYGVRQVGDDPDEFAEFAEQAYTDSSLQRTGAE